MGGPRLRELMLEEPASSRAMMSGAAGPNTRCAVTRSS